MPGSQVDLPQRVLTQGAWQARVPYQEFKGQKPFMLRAERGRLCSSVAHIVKHYGSRKLRLQLDENNLNCHLGS